MISAAGSPTAISSAGQTHQNSAEKIKKKIGIDIAPEPKQAIENVASDDKIKKETSSDEKKTEVSKVKKQTSDKKLEAENKPKK